MIEYNLNSAIKIRKYIELDSTNTEAMRLAREGAGEWTVITAEKQTAGRGRYHRKWESTKNLGLWFSVILFPKAEMKEFNKINLTTSLLLAEFLDNVIRQSSGNKLLEARVKWPNDILVNGRKICGILLESATTQKYGRFLIVGIGLNVNQLAEDFSSEVRQSATSLRMLTGIYWEVPKLLEKFLKFYYIQLNQNIEDEFSDVVTDYQKKMLCLNEPIVLNTDSGKIEGVNLGITAEGFLRLKTIDGERIIRNGEIWRF